MIQICLDGQFLPCDKVACLPSLKHFGCTKFSDNEGTWGFCLMLMLWDSWPHWRWSTIKCFTLIRRCQKLSVASSEGMVPHVTTLRQSCVQQGLEMVMVSEVSCCNLWHLKPLPADSSNLSALILAISGICHHDHAVIITEHKHQKHVVPKIKKTPWQYMKMIEHAWSLDILAFWRRWSNW